MRLVDDDRARVPFAIVGALIIMLSIFSTAYLGSIQHQDASQRIIGAELSRQKAALRQAEDTISTEGYYIASKSVLIATQFLCNQSLLDKVFQENYSTYLEDKFPYFNDPYSVEVRDFGASIFLEEQNLHDLVPSDERNSSNITLTDQNGTSITETMEVLDTSSSQEFNETSALARYVIVGYGNCTVKNTRTGSVMEAPISFEKSIDTPFPLMNSKMLALESQCDNNVMGIGRIVKYVLTTIAQFRVLEGYGSGLDESPGNTSQIINNHDIEMAVNLAVILETARLFRDYDESAIENAELSSLLENYVTTGTLDPGDIVALHMDIGEHQLPVDMMLAQALNAIADQFILKYLDYLGITDIANAVYSTCQKVGQLIEDVGNSLSNFIFGSDGENRDGMQQVMDWIEEITSYITWPPQFVSINGVLPGDYGDSTDLAVLDILQPVSNVYQYNATCIQLISETLEPITDTDGQEIGFTHIMSLKNFNVSATTRPSSATSYSGYLVDFQPSSITRQSPEVEALWTQFYNDFYADQEDVIYSTIRDAVKNMTLEMASLISMFINQADLSLAEYDDGKYAIDPKDEISILQSISHMVDDVMQETMEHLHNNQAVLGTMLNSLTDKQSQLIINLMEFVSQNYDILANKDYCMASGLQSLANSILLNSTTSVTSNGTISANYSEYNSVGISRGFTDDSPVIYHCNQYPEIGAVSRAIYEEKRSLMAVQYEDHLSNSYSKLKNSEVNWEYFGSLDNGLFIKELEKAVQAQKDNALQKFIGNEPDSLINMAGKMVAKVLENIVWSGEVSNTQYCPEIVYSDGEKVPFDLYEGQNDSANIWYEYFSISQSLESLDISIYEPSGVHYTDAITFNNRPFETSWMINIEADLNVDCTSSSRPYIGNASHEPAVLKKAMELDLKIPILVYSGWNLQGIEYAGTGDLADDIGKALDMIKDFFGWVWDTLAGPINWIIDQIMKVVEFFQDIIGTLLGYASEIMNIITDIMGYLVELAQDFLRDIADWVFDGIVGWILEQLPDNVWFTFSMFGFDFNVTFAAMSALDAAEAGEGATLMNIQTEGQILGAGFDVGIELCMLSDEVAEAVGIDYDLLLSSQVQIKGFTLDTKIDPFMVTQEHLVECTGGGAGWGLELVVPEIESYDSVQYSLHDIPGVGAALSNIPIPPLGVKASINAGLEIVYTLRGLEAEHIVINEVELNPRGRTEGNQWVELYNPTEMPVLVEDWNLTSPTNNVSYSFPEGMTIDPGGYYIAEFTNDTLLQEDTILKLFDGSGTVIDFTIALSDDDSLGSQDTWQRSPNGANLTMAGEWIFNSSTKYSENIGVDLDFKQIAWNLIKGAFNTTWQDLKDQLELSLDFIVKLVTQFIQRFIEDVLRVVERSVVETSLFLDVQLTDMTGSGGGGITLSFVIEGGDTLAQILRWIIDSVATFLANFGKPTQPSQYPKLSPEVPEHLFIRLDFYGMVQVPKMVKQAVQNDQDMDPIKLAGRIEANIPALAQLTGREMGQWRINFGVYVEEMPADIADPLFGTGDATPDVWLFKGTVYEC